MKRDKPWIMRTYSGHSTPKASNALYRENLARGQTGLSVAFDLPTQTGYDADHPLARGEVGRTGVPIAHLGDLRELFAGIDLARMNTSMTINATAAWLLALYVAAAEEQGADPKTLRGTTQNDIIKEYLSRGTHVFPPEPSLRLTVDTILYTVEHVPDWNPINICSYHLQEAGATPEQEVAYALSTAIAVLDRVRERGMTADQLAQVFGRLSFFVNAGIRFVDEVCKLRAFAELWDRIGKERYGVADEKQRRFRYGVQVNSLGLTEAQPENNVQRIVLEMLSVTLSKRARARSIQLPAWNEALGLPRPWDQQWSLRMQQVLAFETDLLEYGDVFDGSHEVERLTSELRDAAWTELEDVLAIGGAFGAVDELKGRLVRSMAERTRRIESGEQVVVGVNRFIETEPSPLAGEESFLKVDPAVEAETVADVQRWRQSRDSAAVAAALESLRMAALGSDNIMPATIELARVGGTTGEWSGALREVFGEFRAPTGVASAVGGGIAALSTVAARSRELAGGPPRFLVGKPGLDGHSNGAEQIAVAARDAGMEVVYSGIRLTPAQIAAAARDEDPDVIGLSILSGSHLTLVPEVMELLRAEGVDAPVIVGGIIPEGDRGVLMEQGVAAVYTPKDFQMARIMEDVVDLARKHRDKEPTVFS
jgi:(2R)-ethylmalonyl-CoA mutase